MKEEIKDLLSKVQNGSAAFTNVLEFIDARYQHQPTAFKNGDTHNEAAQNQGSARVFYFAQLNDLGRQDTLQLFAEHYQSVLNTPEENDHQNIRQFMQHGWDGIVFEGTALTEK